MLDAVAFERSRLLLPPPEVETDSRKHFVAADDNRRLDGFRNEVRDSPPSRENCLERSWGTGVRAESDVLILLVLLVALVVATRNVVMLVALDLGRDADDDSPSTGDDNDKLFHPSHPGAIVSSRSTMADMTYRSMIDDFDDDDTDGTRRRLGLGESPFMVVIDRGTNKRGSWALFG